MTGAWEQLPVYAARLGLALALGALLGWEREHEKKPAGLRTHMMVSLGSASVMLATVGVLAPGLFPNDYVRLDPTRVIAGVVGGIGFLGAGTIIRSRGSVAGITTAASIWVTGAIGVACGLGAHSLALLTGIGAFLVLRVVGAVEARLLRR